MLWNSMRSWNLSSQNSNIWISEEQRELLKGNKKHLVSKFSLSGLKIKTAKICWMQPLSKFILVSGINFSWCCCWECNWWIYGWFFWSERNNLEHSFIFHPRMVFDKLCIKCSHAICWADIHWSGCWTVIFNSACKFLSFFLTLDSKL